MKRTLITIKGAVQAAWIKLYCAMIALSTIMVAKPAFALNGTDLDKQGATGKDFKTVAENIDGASRTMATVLIQLVSVGGFVVVAISLYQLYKASKDEREKPTSAIVGLFIGGAMAAVGTIMWIMRNTVIGDSAAGGGATP